MYGPGGVVGVGHPADWARGAHVPEVIPAVIRPAGTRPRRSPYNRRMLQQRTLKSITRAVGVGLHSGQKVEMTLRPAAPDTGIVLRRVALPQPVDIPVVTTAVSDTRMASTISPG